MNAKLFFILLVLAVVVVGGLYVTGFFDVSVELTPTVPPAVTDTPRQTGGSTPQAPTVGDPPAQADPGQQRTEVPRATTAAAESVAGDGTLAGRVVRKSDRAGVAEAIVQLYIGPASQALTGFGPGTPTGIETKTDADGTYTFDKVGPGSNYVAVATHPDYARGQWNGINLVEGGMQIVPDIVLGEGRTIRGTLIDCASKAPIPGATVELWDIIEMNFRPLEERRAWATAKTDANGKFEFVNVHFFTYEVVASADTYATAVVRETRLFFGGPPPNGESSDFALEVCPGRTIAGAVVDKAGLPVPGARVEATQTGPQGDKPTSKGDGESNANGRFEINGLAEGSYVLSASAKGFSHKYGDSAVAGDSSVKIELEAQGAVAGVVRQPNGSPATRFELRPYLVVEGNPNGQASPLPGSMFFESRDGSYSFTGLDPNPSKFLIEAIADGWAPTKSVPFAIDRGKTTTGIDITLKAGATLSGRLVNGKGEPISGGEIAINANNFQSNILINLFAELPGTPKIRTPKVKSGKDGSFRLANLEPSTVQISASGRGYKSTIVNDVVLLENQTTDAGTLVLSAGGTIEGRCVDPQGRPFSDGDVSCVRSDPNNPHAGLTQNTARPDYDGKFRFMNLEPGDWKVSLVPKKLDGEDVNPLLQATYSQKTEQIVPVREGLVSDVTLQVVPYK